MQVVLDRLTVVRESLRCAPQRNEDGGCVFSESLLNGLVGILDEVIEGVEAGNCYLMGLESSNLAMEKSIGSLRQRVRQMYANQCDKTAFCPEEGNMEGGENRADAEEVSPVKGSGRVV